MRRASRIRVRKLAAGVVVAAAILTTSLYPADHPALASVCPYAPIQGAGSSWSFNAIDTWDKNVAQFCLRDNYNPAGSTTGREDFTQGTTDWGASDIPYGVKDGTITDPPPSRGYAYMPDTAGGTTFMYNLKIGTTRVTNLRLSGAAIAGIFTGVITKWNDPTIKADNPGLTMPDLQIVPVVRSDGSGSSAEFTQWMLATEPTDWTNYCKVVGRSPCTQTSAYPLLPNSAMIAQSGDLNVAGYVAQQQADGAIGYVQYSYAINTGFPVAKVLNADGYYTEPTPGHVAVSLLKAQIVGCNPVCSNPTNNPLYLTQDLSQVYSDTDPRTYELSSYSYMILPTTTTSPMNTDKGFTLGAFGSYLLCTGQQQVDALGYSALPINLVLAGFQQLQLIPGNKVQTTSVAQIQSCKNPTFSATDTLGSNLLANTDPNPPACDKVSKTTQCATGTGGATSSTPVNAGAGGSSGGSGSGSGSGSGTTSGSTAGGSGSAANAAAQGCNPDSGTCGSSALGQGGPSTVGGVAVASPVSLGDGLRVALMALAAALLLGLILAPPLVSQAGRRRRPPGGTGSPGSPGGPR